MAEKIAIPNYPMFTQVPIVLIGSYVDGVANFATIGAFGDASLSGIGGEYFALGARVGRVFHAGRELIQTPGPEAAEKSPATP